MHGVRSSMAAAIRSPWRRPETTTPSPSTDASANPLLRPTTVALGDHRDRPVGAVDAVGVPHPFIAVDLRLLRSALCRRRAARRRSEPAARVVEHRARAAAATTAARLPPGRLSAQRRSVVLELFAVARRAERRIRHDRGALHARAAVGGGPVEHVGGGGHLVGAEGRHRPVGQAADGAPRPPIRRRPQTVPPRLRPAVRRWPVAGDRHAAVPAVLSGTRRRGQLHQVGGHYRRHGVSQLGAQLVRVAGQPGRYQRQERRAERGQQPDGHGAGHCDGAVASSAAAHSPGGVWRADGGLQLLQLQGHEGGQVVCAESAAGRAVGGCVCALARSGGVVGARRQRPRAHRAIPAGAFSPAAAAAGCGVGALGRVAAAAA
eukprot:ctg_2686.g386